MDKEQEQRLAQFEKMKQSLEEQFADVTKRLDQLRSEGKQKTATYMQLWSNKIGLENMLQMYKLYDIK